MANIVPVTISDALFYKTDPVFQYNEGDQLLVIDGITLPASYRVDFSNHIDNYMAYTVTGDASGAVIPPEILANGNTIYAFYVDESGDTVTTQYRIEIPVIRRPMPEDYVPSPSSHGIINQLTQDVGDLKSDLGDLNDLETTAKNNLVAAINEAAQSGGRGALTQDTKQVLLQCFAHTAWTDAHGQDYYGDLEDALYPFDLLSTISAVYTQSGTVYDTDSLDSLKADLVVTGTYSDGTYNTIRNYTLSGTLTVGTSTVTVTYGGKTTTFNVTVSQAAATLTSISAVYTQSGTVYSTDTLDILKTDLVVTAHYSDSTTETISSSDYTLSGTLSEPTSVITVAYNGKSTTFNVNVTVNYFDPTTATILNSYIDINSRTIKNWTSGATNALTFVAVEPNTDYVITKKLSNAFRICTTNAEPNGGVPYISTQANHSGTSMNITTEATANYIAIYFWYSGGAYDRDTIFNSIKVVKATA